MTPVPEEWQFDTRLIGRRTLVFDELESTNSTAMAAANRAADGLAIIARNQTAGRGRFNRVWRSRPGSALLLSVICYPPTELRRPVILTAWAAVAVAGAVERLTGRQPRIKWPNDLFLDGKKICGILIEQSAATIVGIGLNLNQTREEFDAAGLPLAASLVTFTGQPIDLRVAAEAVLTSLDFQYRRLLEGERHLVEEEWSSRCGLLGHTVQVERSDGARGAGRLTALRFDGLQIEVPGGGEITLIPEAVEHVTRVD
jgi:BirA family biotin operon repressor/biotin-[acetyl-CoA-carboxylase] ligase